MGFGDFMMGTPGQMTQQPLRSNMQMGWMNQMGNQAMSGLGSNQFDFAPIEAKARQGFQQQTLPSIAERFSNMGSGGGQRSSAFAGSLGQAASGLDTNLAAMRSDYGMQQQNQLMQMLQMALQPQFENIYQQGQPGALHGLFGGMGQGMGMGAGMGMGLGIEKLLPMLSRMRF
jgi:hypothetical protein